MEPIQSASSSGISPYQAGLPVRGGKSVQAGLSAQSGLSGVAGATDQAAAAQTGSATSAGASSQVSISGSTSMSSTSSMSSASSATVHQQVETFLSSVGQGLGDNQYLKLLIAALIMQVLLGQDGGMQQSGQSGLKALEGLAGGHQNSLYLAIESSTNTTQMQQQSSRLEVSGAIQSMAATDAGQTSTGGQVDVTG